MLHDILTNMGCLWFGCWIQANVEKNIGFRSQSFFILIYLFLAAQVLVAACRIFSFCWGVRDLWLWLVNSVGLCVGASSLTQDQTWAPYIGSTES